ncbi:hypothetical protein BH92_10465 [Rhodococcoides fascians A21d2]|uniref:hypothetical protein n=1 Tax=Rhodococcoides fascians TaxID=1828 RepID=UPI0012D2AC45|nr:hypothetical protein [Rhodococcus fascians]QII00243.1 hypothetical protein BH92_10465 [Rhodococcus fascians A21d2]
MTTFKRDSSWFGSTFAYRAFRSQFTELNRQYWGGKPSELFAKRFLAEHDGTDTLDSALGVSSADWRRVGHSIDDYRSAYASHNTWRTLSTLILLTSSFEQYIDSVARLAAMSDPLLSPGFPKRLDGTMLLKYHHSLPTDSSSITKGEWSGRISTYRCFFTHVPDILCQAEGELEKIRRMRNKIAHQFGLDDEKFPVLRDIQPERLSENRLTKWFEVVDGCAGAIERHLRTDFIGDFDTIRLYAEWTQNPGRTAAMTGIAPDARINTAWRSFSKLLGGYTGHTPGYQYCRSLISFYNAV